MKIIYFAFNLSILGGVRAQNRAFIGALKDMGNQVKLVELKKSSSFGKLSFVLRAFFAEIFYRPQLIIVGHVNFSPLCLFFKKIFGTKYIITTHGTDVWGLKSKSRIAALKNADKIISVSSYTANRMESEIGGLAEKFMIIPNTIDPDKFKIRPKSAEFLEKYNLVGKKIILTVARLSAQEKYKGYCEVIRAMPAILKSVPSARYLLVGSGDDEARIKNLISELALNKEITLAGRIGDNLLVDCYNSADVFAMPSSIEGFGIVFIESTACGVPVVAGNKDGSVGATLNGELGILVDPNSTNEIAAAIISILSGTADKRFYDKEFLRKKTLENFGPNILSQKIAFLLDKLK